MCKYQIKNFKQKLTCVLSLKTGLFREGTSLRASLHSHFEIGLTSVELLVVMLIASLLLAMAAPNLNDWILQTRRQQMAQALWLGMMQAKSEAIKRNSRVAVCKSLDGVTCAPTGGWEQGWLVFHDLNNSGTREQPEELISSYIGRETGVVITSTSNMNKYVSFSPLGFSKMLGGAFQAGNFKICPLDGQEPEVYSVVLNSLGRARVEMIELSKCWSN